MRNLLLPVTITCLVSYSFYLSQAIGAPQAVAQSEHRQIEPDESGKLAAEQKQLLEKYKLFEQKLLSLHQHEKQTNPTRSKLLQRAFIQSQEQRTADQMNRVIDLLETTDLKTAENQQQAVLDQLDKMLQLLQSEDRSKRVRDELKRHQAYLKEVERIIRIQKGIRGQAEGGISRRRLSRSQEKAADRTKQLGDEIRKNEDQEPEDPSDQQTPNRSAPDQQSPTPGESPKKPPAKNPPTENPPTENPPTENPPSPKSPDRQAEAEKENVPQTPAQRTRRRIEAAEKRMREAQKKLDDAKSEDKSEAITEMQAAEREMALAKKELEEILRQLREEEIERTLASLEDRFRQMLEREVRVLKSTQSLANIEPANRGTDFEIQTGKQSTEQNAIAAMAAQALLLLREDGTSVAFPFTVEEMRQDMIQVAKRLAAAKVGSTTIAIEQDIIDTLEFLVSALVQTKKDLERAKKQSKNNNQGQQPQAGEKSLVDQIAELKMLRGLQERILNRHQRYSKLLENPDDLVGNTDDPELRSALVRLAEKQAQLTAIARDIVNEKNK